MATIHQRVARELKPDLSRRTWYIDSGLSATEDDEAREKRIAAILEREYGPVLQKLCEVVRLYRSGVEGLPYPEEWQRETSLSDAALAAAEACGFVAKGGE